MGQKEPWEIWADFVLLALEDAKESRKENRKDLEKFISETFAAFIKEEFNPLRDQVREIERCVSAKAKANKEKKKEATQVKVAKITSRWEFWGIVVMQLVVLAVAIFN